MAQSKEKTIAGALKALYSTWTGMPVANDTNAPSLVSEWAFPTGTQLRHRNAADTDYIRTLASSSADQITLGGEALLPMYKTVRFNVGPAAAQVSDHFFIADQAYRVVSITEIHKTAETTAATLTGYVEKLASGIAPGSGSTLMSGTFNFKATANTLQTATLYEPNTGNSDDPLIHLATGDRLSLVFSTTATELVGVDVEVVLAPRTTGSTVQYLSLNGAIGTDNCVFIANRDCIITRIDYVHGTAAGQACNLQVTKDTGTDAPGAGTDLLTNDTNSGFEGDGTANVVQNGALTATAANLRLAPGNRISVDYSGTTTSLAKVLVTITLQYVENRMEVTYAVQPNASLADQVLFTADRGYEVIAASAVWSTASGGATNVQLTRDTGTDAPGAGTDLLSNDTNAGFQTDGTANTVEVGTWKDTRFNFLMAGDRLSLDFSGTLTSLVGVVVTVSLRKA